MKRGARAARMGFDSSRLRVNKHQNRIAHLDEDVKCFAVKSKMRAERLLGQVNGSCGSEPNRKRKFKGRTLW
jgi:predicted nucleic acid-binding Zn ribbon protein